jgi:hypothetical protein
LPLNIRISEALQNDSFLLYSDKTTYDHDEDAEYQDLFVFEVEDVIDDDGFDRQSLAVFNVDGPAPVRVDANNVFGEYGTFQFLKHPEPRDIGEAALEPPASFPNISPVDYALHVL